MVTPSRKGALRKGFTLKLIFGERVYSLRLTPAIILSVLALLGVLAWQGVSYYQSRINNYCNSIAELEQANSQYRTAIALKEREKEQMAALANERFDELCSQLNYQDKKLNAIGSKVGKSQKGRKALKGSRSGDRNNAISIKLKYKGLISSVKNREVDITKLGSAVADFRAKLNRQRHLASLVSRPSAWPVAGEITSDYGYRTHPVYGYARLHTGLDIAANSGTPIQATAAGVVTSSGWLGGYGNAVIIAHRNGLSTLYGHCSQLKVSTGQTVRKGDIIALVGSTGVSTGPHLHYEVQANGQHINPIPYLSQVQ